MSVINSQIQNLRLRIEILQDKIVIESDTCYELSKEHFSSSLIQISIERVKQIGKRVEVLEEELEELCREDLEYKLSTRRSL